MAENFVITRTPGVFGAGGWIPGTPQIIQAYGVVSVASAKDLDAVPEGDRVKGSMVFHSTNPMFVTNGLAGATSDVLNWNGDQYRVYNVGDYSNRGYYKAIACRLLGS